MMPGINPKQMKAAMRKMGMQMNEIENVTKVVVYTASGETEVWDATSSTSDSGISTSASSKCMFPVNW